MANITQIASNVRRNLDDLGANFYDTNLDIIPSIQDGYNLIAAITESIEKQVAISIVSDLVVYDMPTYIPDYLRIFAIYNNNTKIWLTPSSLIELSEMRQDWELMEGEPFCFVPIDYRHIAICPTPTIATGTLTVMYRAKADTLSANSVPQIPQEHVKALEYYATGDLLTQAEEWIKAIDQANLLNASIDDIRRVLRNRSTPNQTYRMREIF
jgi:hypothetical protein